VQFIKLHAYPTILAGVFAYCFLQYWWIVGITTLVPAAYEQYSPRSQGLLLLGLLVGLLAAELFCSGHLSDKIMVWTTKKNGGERIPENRLWLGMPAAVISSVGLLVWGFSVHNEWHWITGQVAFALCTWDYLQLSILFIDILPRRARPANGQHHPLSIHCRQLPQPRQ
jgi:MFS family permease